MSLLIATAGASNANSYVTVARANQLLSQRLYAAKWFSASSTPSADGYQAAGGASLGAASLAVDSGTGTFTVGTQFQFAGHDTVYTVTTQLATAGTLAFSPVLTAAVLDNEVINRITANEREQCLIWGTSLLDSMMEWNGIKRTTTQSLRIPRSQMYDSDGNVFDYDKIPTILEQALAEFGLALLEKNKFKLPGILGQGISEATVGPISVTVDKNQVEAVIPQNILAMLSPIGHLKSEAQTGARYLPLLRV